jgi:protein-S-isoprenylcysteine O-methyltransferase Ste14
VAVPGCSASDRSGSTSTLFGVLGTALATNLIGLIVVGVLGAYFYYAASSEEKNLTATFPADYPAYRTSTKMLIPFII